jgi:hypothetical protein
MSGTGGYSRRLPTFPSDRELRPRNGDGTSRLPQPVGATNRTLLPPIDLASGSSPESTNIEFSPSSLSSLSSLSLSDEEEEDVATSRHHLLSTPDRTPLVSLQRTPGASFFRDPPPHYFGLRPTVMSKDGSSDKGKGAEAKAEDDDAGSSQLGPGPSFSQFGTGPSQSASAPQSALSLADLTALTAAFAAALNSNQSQSRPAPAVAPRTFVPVIHLVTNRSNFFHNKHWDKKDNHLAYHRRN